MYIIIFYIYIYRYGDRLWHTVCTVQVQILLVSHVYTKYCARINHQNSSVCCRFVVINNLYNLAKIKYIFLFFFVFVLFFLILSENFFIITKNKTQIEIIYIYIYSKYKYYSVVVAYLIIDLNFSLFLEVYLNT